MLGSNQLSHQLVAAGAARDTAQKAKNTPKSKEDTHAAAEIARTPARI